MQSGTKPVYQDTALTAVSAGNSWLLPAHLRYSFGSLQGGNLAASLGQPLHHSWRLVKWPEGGSRTAAAAMATPLHSQPPVMSALSGLLPLLLPRRPCRPRGADLQTASRSPGADLQTVPRR